MERTLLILPTTSCNLKCGYCYVGNKKHFVMSKDTVKSLVDRIEEHLENYDDTISIIWHGGEPSLVPLSFWEYVEHEFSRLDPHRISKGVQTNLTNDIGIFEWFIEHGYRISSSLDGDFQLHSQGRNTTLKQYNLLLENIRRVKQLQGSMGVVCVVSRFHLGKEAELLDFFEEVGVDVRFNMVEAETWPHKISYSEYYSFLIDLAKIWLYRETSAIGVEPILSDVAHLFSDFSESSCDRIPDCYRSFLAINSDGAVYPCSRFTQHPAWRYGYIQERALAEYWNEVSISFFSPLLSSLRCGDCPWHPYCAGGCKYQRVMEDSLRREDFCKAVNFYFSSLSKILRDKIENIEPYKQQA